MYSFRLAISSLSHYNLSSKSTNDEKVGKQMVYDVLLTKESDNRYTARAMLLPNIVVSGTDESQVLNDLRIALANVEANSRTVRLDVPSPKKPRDPWLEFAGIWKDEPDWDLFQAEIEAYRQEIDRQTMMD